MQTYLSKVADEKNTFKLQIQEIHINHAFENYLHALFYNLELTQGKEKNEF